MDYMAITIYGSVGGGVALLVLIAIVICKYLVAITMGTMDYIVHNINVMTNNKITNDVFTIQVVGSMLRF